MSRMENEIARGMARALYCCDWADWAELAGISLAGKEITAIAPATPVAYSRLAWRLMGRYEEANKHGIVIMAHFASKADGKPIVDYDFGFSLAMMARGHGVSWFDDHEKFDLADVSIDTDGAPGDPNDPFYGNMDVKVYELKRGFTTEWTGCVPVNSDSEGPDIARRLGLLNPHHCKLVEP